MKGMRVVFPEPLKVEVEEFKVGRPRKGEVLIENEATLISTGTELTILTGDFPKPSAWARYGRYPFRPGYSSVGRIIKLGPKVEGFNVGDRVAADTPHATHAIVNSERIIKVPEGVSPEEASFHTLAAGVMNSVRLARVALGESVVIFGLGLLGQLAVIFSRLSGGYPVIGVDLAEKRLKLAELSGATATVKGGDWEGVYQAIEELTKCRMADKVFEVTGDPCVIPNAIKAAKRQGYLIILSSPRGETLLDFHDEVNSPSRIIIGTHFSSQPSFETPYNPWTKRRNTELFFDLLSSGVLRINHLITHRYRLDEAEEAYNMLLEDRTRALGVIFKFE